MTRIQTDGRSITGVETKKVELPDGMPFKPANVRDVYGSEAIRTDINAVIVAIGMRSYIAKEEVEGVFYAGDITNGPTTVVDAAASGKNTAAEIDAWFKKQEKPIVKKATKSYFRLPGYNPVPDSLEAEFFGRPIQSPYLLSASPLTDGLDQMNLTYEHGWAGGVMKTAVDNVLIHIPGEYMFSFNPLTYGNSDNVSGHPLDRVCREIEQLVKQWPDRLTIGSTGMLWGREDDAELSLAAAFQQGASVDEAALSMLSDQLWNYGAELGPAAAQRIVDRLSDLLVRLGRDVESRPLVAHCAVTRAFRCYHAGGFDTVPGDVVQAVRNNPMYLLNRGVLSIFVRSLYQRRVRTGAWAP